MLELLTGLAGSDEEGNDISSRLGIKEMLDKPSEAVKSLFRNDVIVDLITAAVSCLHSLITDTLTISFIDMVGALRTLLCNPKVPGSISGSAES